MGIKVLDCTLRDGAYVTEGIFGESCIFGIKACLKSAGVDIIECGWLKNFSHLRDSVFYENAEKLDLNTAIMFDYGKFDIAKLSKGEGIIRIAFYKEDLDKISFAAEAVKNKGYKVFLQASNTVAYSESELEHLCRRANYIGVDSVYIVDSFGSMFPDDLQKIMPIYNEMVDKNIEIGFHSHNNIQLSFALSMQFINYMKRDIIVDSSLCGIGRGAGNTQTELLVTYLNKNGSAYKTEFIKEGIEKYITPLMQKYDWGYNYQRAYKGLNGLHPNTEL